MAKGSHRRRSVKRESQRKFQRPEAGVDAPVTVTYANGRTEIRNADSFLPSQPHNRSVHHWR